MDTKVLAGLEEALCSLLRQRDVWTAEEAVALVKSTFARPYEPPDHPPPNAAADAVASVTDAKPSVNDTTSPESGQSLPAEVAQEEERQISSDERIDGDLDGDHDGSSSLEDSQQSETCEEEVEKRSENDEEESLHEGKPEPASTWMSMTESLSPRGLEHGDERVTLSGSHRVKPSDHSLPITEGVVERLKKRYEQSLVSEDHPDPDDAPKADTERSRGLTRSDPSERISVSAEEEKRSKPVISARGPRPAGRAPRPSIAVPLAPEELAQGLLQMHNDNAGHGFSRSQITPRTAAFLSARGPTHSSRNAHPFLGTSNRKSLRSGPLSSNDSSPEPSNTSTIPSRNSTEIIEAISAASSDAVQTARCISSPALVPINLEEMEQKIEQYKQDWAKLKQQEQKGSRLIQEAPSSETTDDQPSTGSGRKKRGRSSSAKNSSTSSDSAIKERKKGQAGLRSSSTDKKNRSRLTLKHWRSKGKEAEDVSIQVKPRKDKPDDDSVTERKTDAKMETNEDQNSDRHERRRKATIGDWEKAETAATATQRPRLVRTRSAIGMRREQEIYARESKPAKELTLSKEHSTMPNWGTFEEETVTACATCAVAFSRSVRRHRCKSCSLFHCTSCSTGRAKLPTAPSKISRVCAACNTKLTPPSSSLIAPFTPSPPLESPDPNASMPPQE